MAPVIYKSEGEDLAKQLWGETMSELSFARIQDCIQGVSE